MKKSFSKVFKTFFNSKKTLRNVYSILTAIAIFYSVITGIYLLFLLPLIVMWVNGAKGVAFFNVSATKVQGTDISYFTTGDILDIIRLLLIIAVLFFVSAILRRREKKLQ